MNREKLYLSHREDDKRFVWVATSRKLLPGQLRIHQSVNKMSNYDRRFLMVIGVSDEVGQPRNEWDRNRSMVKWLVLRSNGVLETEYQSTLEGMFLVTCEDPGVYGGNLGT